MELERNEIPADLNSAKVYESRKRIKRKIGSRMMEEKSEGCQMEKQKIDFIASKVKCSLAEKSFRFSPPPFPLPSLCLFPGPFVYVPNSFLLLSSFPQKLPVCDLFTVKAYLNMSFSLAFPTLTSPDLFSRQNSEKMFVSRNVRPFGKFFHLARNKIL